MLGFFLFVRALPGATPETDPQGDAVVVFTGGGGSRIAAAMNLFANGAGQRLLISGVHPNTSRTRLSELWVGAAEKFECCVDLGHDALTTEGNAEEMRAWMMAKNFNSMILVTSDYHMPRAMTLARARMPRAQIVAYAVPSGYLTESGWPTSVKAMRSLAGEYVKYLLARIKLLFGA